ncbi:MAG: hypothetical protein CVU14_02235 [Bacteroidetes bacterium HGW-Bacteroidetes-9]|jgi:1-acyl-sn-glycerol-3-phosphate acyltransferase|nr:MAG: hypothetical protein CVU14_02235 [Bacteroidetes bacterium HGW-Bacteroidetes-9]
MRNLHVEKSSLRYRLLFELVRFYFRIFYRRFTVTGKENIPTDVPVIFAANHQNALMDALAMLFAANRPVVFLARADIFKKARIARLLYFLKILPVYRIRDGLESMGNNADTFDMTVKVLQSGTPLAILPEGTHTSIKRLQQLKKGICRIAFQAAESSNFKLNIQIVPVGLDYTNYQNAGTHLLVNYGKPIRVSDYFDLYNENAQKALAQLRDDLAIAIKKVMIHVENKEFYHSIQSLTEVLLPSYLEENKLPDNRVNRFEASQKIIDRIHTASEENKINLSGLQKEIQDYQQLLDKNKLKSTLFEIKTPSIWFLLISVVLSLAVLPLHLYGMVVNYLPYKIPVLISRKMKDAQFISSVNFGLSLPLYIIWYMFLFVILTFLTGNSLIVMLILLSWPLAGLFTFYHFRYLKKLAGKIRLYRLRHNHPKQFGLIEEARQKLIRILEII